MKAYTTKDHTPPLPPRYVNTQRVIRIGLIIILFAFGAGGVWAALAPLASAIIATGVLKVTDNRKTVQHHEGGVIKEILVRDGDHVVAGQPLIVLEDEQIRQRLDFLSSRLDAKKAKAARLRAERDYLTEPRFPQELLDRTADTRTVEIVRVENVLFQATRRALLSQLELLAMQGKKIGEEIDSLKYQLNAEAAALKLLVDELEVNEKLVQQHAVAQVTVLPLRRGVEEHKSRRGKLNAAIARAQQHALDSRLRTIRLRNRYMQGAADELSKINAEIFDFEERIHQLRSAIRRQVVVAPTIGEVVSLKVFTVGGVVSSGEPLLDIVPLDQPLIVEARIDIDDIDSVRPGMLTRIRLTAYPARSTASLKGVLTYVSADRYIDERSAAPHFLTHVSIDPKSLTKGDEVQLNPGMHAEVFIETGERTAMAYLLEPITATLGRALREP